MGSIKKHLPASSRKLEQTIMDLTRRIDSLSTEIQSIKNLMMNQREDKGIYLIAEPGYPNYGDEIIAREWLIFLAERFPNTPIYLDCICAGSASAILRGYHPNLTILDTVSRLTFDLVNEEERKNYQNLSVSELGERIIATLDDEGRAARSAAGIHILQQKVKLVHYLGGGYMNGMWRENLARLALATWAHSRGISVIGTGLGLAPLNGAELDFALEAIGAFDSVSVRDEETLGLLLDNGISSSRCQLAPDDCFVNALKGMYSSEDHYPSIMLCVQSDLVSNVDELYSHVMSQLLVWGVTRDTEIGVVECVPYTDYGVYEYLSEKGFSVRLFPAIYLIERGFPAREGQRWLSTRYHPHILASAKGCAGSYIVVDNQYYRAKHEAVVRMGSRWSESVLKKADNRFGLGFENHEAASLYSREIREHVRIAYGV